MKVLDILYSISLLSALSTLSFAAPLPESPTLADSTSISHLASNASPRALPDGVELVSLATLQTMERRMVFTGHAAGDGNGHVKREFHPVGRPDAADHVSSEGQIQHLAKRKKKTKTNFKTTTTIAAAAATEAASQGLKLAMVYESITSQKTSVGTITEKCLTPLNDPSQQFCQTLLDGQSLGGGDAGLTGSTGSSNSSSSSAVSSRSSSSVASSSSSAVASSSSSTTASVASSSAAVSSSSAVASADIASSTKAAAASISSSSSADTATASISSDSASVTESSTSSVDVTAASDGVSTSSVSSAALAAASGADQVTAIGAVSTTDVPGQNLQVLPIGLGIFGGLAAITLIVVGYVTWQRRRFKQQFRSRKLAEKAAPPGMA